MARKLHEAQRRARDRRLVESIGNTAQVLARATTTTPRTPR